MSVLVERVMAMFVLLVLNCALSGYDCIKLCTCMLTKNLPSLVLSDMYRLVDTAPLNIGADLCAGLHSHCDSSIYWTDERGAIANFCY